jgi:hypothetical protein
MTAFARTGTRLTNFTLAFLEDSGWYIVNYSKAQNIYWGRNKGCEFFNNFCYSNLKFNEFCSINMEKGCLNDLTTKGVCGLEDFSDGCFTYTDVLKQADCTDPTIAKISKTKETFGPTSLCIKSDYIRNIYSEVHGHRCFPQTCGVNSTGGLVLKIEVDTNEIYECLEKQEGVYLESKNPNFKGLILIIKPQALNFLL